MGSSEVQPAPLTHPDVDLGDCFYMPLYTTQLKRLTSRSSKGVP
jgi:hypothetical protein